MHCKKAALFLTVLMVVSYEPKAYAWGISKEAMGQFYQATKSMFIQSVAPMLMLQGIVLASELSFNKVRAIAWGNKVHIEDPCDVPEGRGQVAPETVPGPIQELISRIQSPERLEECGCKEKRGFLLYGESGCGKTELGYYIARETGAKVLYQSAASLMTAAPGAGADAIRQMFDKGYNQSLWTRFKNCIKSVATRIMQRQYRSNLQSQKPIVLILDDIDAIGCSRQETVSAESRVQDAERHRTLEQLLTEIAGAHEETVIPKVFVVGTTREPIAAFDPALIRDGRLRPIKIDRLDNEQRAAVLSHHAFLKFMPLAEGVNLATIAQKTKGFNGCQLKKLLREAAFAAVCRGNNKLITQADMVNAMHTVWAEKRRFAARKRIRRGVGSYV